MTRGKLHARGALVNGTPRHHHAVCSSGCGWRGNRTADSAAAVGRGRPCPRCGATVRAVNAA